MQAGPLSLLSRGTAEEHKFPVRCGLISPSVFSPLLECSVLFFLCFLECCAERSAE
jgi:hypothetical protein